MRPPARYVAGHLLWSAEGSCWAFWRVAPTNVAYAGPDAAEAHRLATRAALLALPPEARLGSVCRPLPPGEVVEALIDGVDLDAHRAWAKEATAALDLLCETEAWERLRYLGVCLPDSAATATKAAVAAAGAAVAAAFGLPAPPPAADERLRRARQAEEVERRLERLLPVERLTAAEIDWLTARRPRRALSDPTVAEIAAGRRPGPSGESALRALDGATWWEGGDPAAADGPLPRGRRLCSATTAAGTSWQAYAALAALPDRWAFPGTWLTDADRLAIGADWVAHIEAVPNPTARTRTRRSHRRLVAQVSEWEHEASGPPPELAAALESIEDERARLAANPTDPELAVAVSYGVAGTSPVQVDADIAALAEAMGASEFVLPRPAGGQVDLARAGFPGAGLTRTERDYRNLLLPGDLAAALPFAGVSVGDPVGCLWGWALDDAPRPVLLDPSYGPRVLRRNGSIGVVGDNGSGKSYATKRLVWTTVARGGRVVVLDRTERGEWAEFAGLVGGAQVVRVGPGEALCVDPLRVFPAGHPLRTQLALGLLLIATRSAAAELPGTALARAVAQVAERYGGTSADVLSALSALAADGHPEADEVGRKLANLAGAALGRLVFGDGAVLDLDGDLVVLHVPGLALPERAVLASETLSRFLLPEQLWSQALLYLLAGIGRAAIFGDRRRFGALVVDEAWAITASMEGEALLTETIRDGPKHNAAVWIVSQDVERLGSRAVRDLLRVRMAFRHTTASAAAEALDFCGVPPTDALADALADPALPAGTQLLRDVRGGVGMVRVAEALQVTHRPWYSTYGDAEVPTVVEAGA